MPDSSDTARERLAAARDKPPATPAPVQPAKRTKTGAPSAFQASPEPVSVASTLPAGKPNKTLEGVGYIGTMQEFNNRVSIVTDTYRRRFGTKPKPGLVMDLARNQYVKTDEIKGLIEFLPLNSRAAKVGQIAKGPAPLNEGLSDDEVTLQDMQDAIRGGTYRSWLDENADWIRKADDDLRDEMSLRFAIANNQLGPRAEALNRAKPTETAAFLRKHATESPQSSLRRAGYLPPGDIKRAQEAGVFAGGDTVGLAAKQIFQAVALGVPFLVLAESKAAIQSVKERSARPLVETNKQLGKAVVEGIVSDIRNPRANPGYVLLDLFGVASFGAGTVSRLGAVGAAARTGKGVGRAALTRPNAGTRIARFGDLEVPLLNSENALVRQFQKMTTEMHNQARTPRPGESYIPPELGGRAAPSALNPTAWGARFFGQEAKARRALEAERRLERTRLEITKKDLEQAIGWSTQSGLVQSTLPERVRGLSRPQQMAILVESIDHPGDFTARANALRDFHTRQIRLGLGDEAAHNQKLRDIRLAEKAIERPTDRFAEALRLTRQAVDEMQSLKAEYGLTETAANRRVANVARVISGDPLTKESALGELASLRRNLAEDKGDTGAVLERIAELRAKISELPRDISRRADALKLLQSKRNELAGDPAAVAKIDKQIARVNRQIETSTAMLDGIELLRDESFYFPLRLNSKGRLQSGFRSVRQSVFGVSARNAKADIPGLKHQFDGRSLQLGAYRVNVSRLVADDLGKTIRGTMLLSEYKKLLKASHPSRRSEWDVPIRKPGTRGVPDELRAILDREPGAVTADEARVLSRTDWEGLVRSLYGAEYDANTGKWRVKDEGRNFAWVDSRLLGSDAAHAPAASVLQKSGQLMNTPFRTITLYGRPAYITNLVGSAGMALVYQGPFAGPNFARALLGGKLYGDRAIRTMRELVGSGKSSSYVDERLTSKAERKAAGFWNTVTDRDLRVSSLIYYLRKQGHRSPEQVKTLMDSFESGDAAAVKAVNEAAMRAKKSMVEFDNLSWFEREYVKHFVFIYPWQSRSLVWNVRTLVERPVTGAILANLGEQAGEEITHQVEATGGSPEDAKAILDWFKKTGYFPISWDSDGNPVAVNAGSQNTLASIAGLISDPGDVNAYRRYLGPMADIAIGAVTGRDQFGRTYDRTGIVGNPVSAFLEAAFGLPQVSAYLSRERAEGQEPLPGVNIADRDTLITRRNKALKQMVLAPGWSLNLAGLVSVPGQLLSGALGTPRVASRETILARAYSDLPRELQQEANRELVDTALGLQGEALGQSVPPKVRSAVDDMFRIDAHVDNVTKEQGGHLSDSGKLAATLDYLRERGLIDERKAQSLLREAGKLEADELDDFRADAVRDAVDPAGALQAWDERISVLATASDRASLEIRVKRLIQDGVAGSLSRDLTKLTEGDLRKYARRVVEYVTEEQALVSASNDRNATDAQKLDASFKLRALRAEADTDVEVAGRRLPSPVRFLFADATDADRAAAVASWAGRDWTELSSFQKEALGREGVHLLDEAWVEYDRAVATYKASAPAGSRSVQVDQLRAVAKQLDAQVPGFFRDWLIAQQPLAERAAVLRPIVESPNAPQWKELLGAAKQITDRIRAGYPESQAKDYWSDLVDVQIVPNLSEYPAFKREVELYGGASFLKRLLDANYSALKGTK